MVGVPGLEPGASRSQTERDSQLRHTPTQGSQYEIELADFSRNEKKAKLFL